MTESKHLKDFFNPPLTDDVLNAMSSDANRIFMAAQEQSAYHRFNQKLIPITIFLALLAVSVITQTDSSELKGLLGFSSLILVPFLVFRNVQEKKMEAQSKGLQIQFRDKYEVIASPGGNTQTDTYLIVYQVERNGKVRERFLTFDSKSFLQIP